jgi:type I restriction enzyme M protein
LRFDNSLSAEFIVWLKDESLEASYNLPDPVIAQEIVEDLETALEQFREIVTDLSNGKSSNS